MRKGGRFNDSFERLGRLFFLKTKHFDQAKSIRYFFMLHNRIAPASARSICYSSIGFLSTINAQKDKRNTTDDDENDLSLG